MFKRTGAVSLESVYVPSTLISVAATQPSPLQRSRPSDHHPCSRTHPYPLADAPCSPVRTLLGPAHCSAVILLAAVDLQLPFSALTMTGAPGISNTAGPELSRVQEPTALAPDQLSSTSPASELAQTKMKPRAGATQAPRMGQGDRQQRPNDILVGQQSNPSSILDPASPPRMPLGAASASPHRTHSPYANAASPGMLMRSASPRHLSPATSQIFERDVQESVVAPELSPAIPSHIQTEDHIPPVLEASSLALTDTHLDPDEVEIITHSAHQPAAVTVTGSNMSDSYASMSGMSSLNELAASSQDHDEASSAYGAVDPNDARRLSFISFADVVHAEHVEGARDGVHPLSSAASISGNRSPSPIRSPLSFGGTGGSPPLSGAASFRGAETSPVRGTGASISSAHGPHGELTIETMRQTLQKTGSNDIGGPAGHVPGAISPDDSTPSRFHS